MNSHLLQNKFTSLSLAFKTDKLTLTNRLELQQRQRDNAEKNIETEISQLKKAIEVRKPILLFTYLSFQGMCWHYLVYQTKKAKYLLNINFLTNV